MFFINISKNNFSTFKSTYIFIKILFYLLCKSLKVSQVFIISKIYLKKLFFEFYIFYNNSFTIFYKIVKILIINNICYYFHVSY